MAEENNNIPPAAGQGPDLEAELKRTRAGNKALKIAAAGLAVLFLILAGVAFFAYRKISQTKALFEEVIQAGQRPGQASFPENNAIPAALNSFMGGSSSAPVSGLGLFSGSMPGGGAESVAAGMAAKMTPEDADKVAAVMQKYTERPIWKEMMADLKKDPEMARALDTGKGGNPMAMIGAFQKSNNVNKIMMKYVARPDFLKLMMELASDRDLKPMLKKLPPGIIPGGDGPAEPPAPQVRDIPVEGQAEEGGGGALVLDPSAISGTGTATKTRVNKAPPPLENNR